MSQVLLVAILLAQSELHPQPAAAAEFVTARGPFRQFRSAVPPGVNNTQFSIDALAQQENDKKPAAAAAAPKFSVVLTPDTMAAHGFHIHLEVFDQAAKLPTGRMPPEGPIRVSVHFDPVKGPAIKPFKSSPLDDAAFLVVREGDAVLLSAPVSIKPWVGNEGGLYVRFSTQKDLLPKTQLVLDKDRLVDGLGSFTVDLKAFIKEASPQAAGDAAPASKSVNQFPDSLIETELLRTPPNGFERNNFYLYIRPQRADLEVTARCYLWKDGQNVGRFPLARVDNEHGRIPSEMDRGRLLFRVECLADEFVAESYISLTIIDEKADKPLPGVKISLKDAAHWRGP